MDIYKYIRSKDVREYNHQIGHKFTTLESAFLVWHNRALTLDEKHAGWREIILDMPDEQVEYRGKSQHSDSLFKLLEQFIQDDNKLIQEFYKQDSQAVYSYQYADGSDCWRYNDHNRIYTDFDYMRRSLRSFLPKCDGCEVEYTKRYLSSPDNNICLTVNANEQIMDVQCTFISSQAAVQKNDFFQCLWVDIPTPFRVGDIVCGATEPFAGKSIVNEPFVVKFISNWDGETAVKRGVKLTPKEKTFQTERVATLKETGGIHEMKVSGLFSHALWSDEVEGEPFGTATCNYVDLEYYRGEIKDGTRILLPLSNYLQGNIDEETLIRLCEIIKKQEEVKRSIRLLDLDEKELCDLGVE